MKWLLQLTGGRPMRKEGLAFVDQVTGESVYYFRDLLGRKWLSTGAWSMFRIQTQGGGK